MSPILVDFFKQLQTSTYKVFVTQDELVLAKRIGFGSNFYPGDIYRRQKK